MHGWLVKNVSHEDATFVNEHDETVTVARGTVVEAYPPIARTLVRRGTFVRVPPGDPEYVAPEARA